MAIKEQTQGKGIKVQYAALAIIVTIVLFSIPAVKAYGSLDEKVDRLERNYDSSLVTIERIDVRLDKLDQNSVGTGVALQEIKEDISEMKVDLKEIKKELSE